MKKYILMIGTFFTLFIFVFLSILPFIFLSLSLIWTFVGLISFNYFSNLISIFDSWKNKRSNKQSKSSWTLFLILPFAGWIFYLISAKLFLFKRNRIKKTNLFIEKIYKNNPKRIYNFDYDIDAIIGGDNKFPQLIDDLKNAKQTINIEYFIINNGIIWQNLLNVLIKKANEGVKIRILTDFIGNIQTKNSSYKSLKNHPNISFKIFNKFLLPFSSGYSNLRSHHKILVIDNKISYFGGLNIGDDYSHMYSKYGYWFDVQFKNSDQLTKDIQKQFIIDWYRSTGQDISSEFNLEINESKTKNQIQSFSDGYHVESPLFLNELIYQLNIAKKSVKILSPYLILPKELLETFKKAIERGVEIEIITTGKADKKSAYFLAKYYINILINLGIKVYRTNNLFMHAKIFIFDQISIIGTSNLDYRAFYLHFEHNFIIKNNFVNQKINNVFDEAKKLSYLQNKTNHEKMFFIIKIISPIF